MDRSVFLRLTWHPRRSQECNIICLSMDIMSGKECNMIRLSMDIMSGTFVADMMTVFGVDALETDNRDLEMATRLVG